MIKNIKYRISYHKLMECYVLWKEIESDHGWGTLGLFHGTYKECLNKKREILCKTNQ